MWRDVVDHSMASRGRELIDKYIQWKLRKDKLEELGIRNSPDDLRRRAQVIDKVAATLILQSALDRLKLFTSA